MITDLAGQSTTSYATEILIHDRILLYYLINYLCQNVNLRDKLIKETETNIKMKKKKREIDEKMKRSG